MALGDRWETSEACRATWRPVGVLPSAESAPASGAGMVKDARPAGFARWAQVEDLNALKVRACRGAMPQLAGLWGRRRGRGAAGVVRRGAAQAGPRA